MGKRELLKNSCWLLDRSVLVALTLNGHTHHEASKIWFSKSVRKFATCAVTQGTLLRMTMTLDRHSRSHHAWTILQQLVDHPFHEFWEEGFSYLKINPRLIQGHRQVTDAWLVELARKRKGKLATLDIALAQMYPKEVELIAG